MVSFDINNPDRVCIDKFDNGLEIHNTNDRVGIICVRDGYRVTDLWEGSPKDEVFFEEIPEIDEQMEVFPALEGTELRLFWHTDKWHLSTNKKLDAFTSYWGSPLSHGKIFINALIIQYGLSYKEFLTRLSKSNVYVFFLRNYSRNRVVCLAGPYPDVYHIATFSLGNKSVVQSPLDDAHAELARTPRMFIRTLPKILSTRGTYGATNVEWTHPSNDVLVNHVKNTDPLHSQGLIIFTKTRRIKIYSKAYTKMEKIRGTEPCIVRRYLQPGGTTLFDLYPEHAALFADIESRLGCLVQSLAHEYLRTYEDDTSAHIGEIKENVLMRARRKVMLDGGNASFTHLCGIIRAEVAKLAPEQIFKIL